MGLGPEEGKERKGKKTGNERGASAVSPFVDPTKRGAATYLQRGNSCDPAKTCQLASARVATTYTTARLRQTHTRGLSFTGSLGT